MGGGAVFIARGVRSKQFYTLPECDGVTSPGVEGREIRLISRIGQIRQMGGSGAESILPIRILNLEYGI